MNYKKNLILSTLLLSSVATYSMEQDKINNNLSMGNFDKLPKEIQKEIFKYIFEDKYLDSLSLGKLKRVLDLKLLSKKFRSFINDDYKGLLGRTKKDKLGLELINCIQNYNKLKGAFCQIFGFEYKLMNVIKNLIKIGANYDLKNNEGKTALMVACHEGNIEVVKLLIDSKASFDFKDNNGCTASDIAQKGGYLEIALLIESAWTESIKEKVKSVEDGVKFLKDVLEKRQAKIKYFEDAKKEIEDVLKKQNQESKEEKKN